MWKKMCILCMIQKWSRQVATMLPWLVIPLIGLWAFSQMLPPGFRFEITLLRLTCVFVLLVVLLWYEIFFPQLLAWNARRSAQLRERKMFEAIEMQKLKKSATRRCRNCLTAYKDQNPGGGRFMCSYCGHISKRPVLDLPLPPGLGITSSGIIKNLVGKGGKILNGKTWSDSRWFCSQDWFEKGNWVGRSFAGKSCYLRKDGGGIFVRDEHCLAENSYSSVVFSCNLLTSFFMSIRWLWKKIFRVSMSDDAYSDAENTGVLVKRGENAASFQESRGDKSRRKAEEKRQVRLEKELLEVEERKQREEVARLVEERRRLRDEKIEAENRSKESLAVREKESKKEAEKKNLERMREKDKGSSKINSDVEELERRTGESKRDGEKKIDTDQREKKSGMEALKGQNLEMGHGMKNISSNNLSRGNAGNRYLDHMKGTFFSSSQSFSGGSIFGSGSNNPATLLKDNKFNNSVDHTSSQMRDLCPPDLVAAQISTNAYSCHPVHTELQSRTGNKKSWKQLFTRSSTVPPSANTNAIGRPSVEVQQGVQSPPLCGQPSMQLFDNPINFGLPSPFTPSTHTNKSASSTSSLSPPVEIMFPHVGEPFHDFIPEELEVFEDPCYVPDPMSLLGPVSESLDNFQLDSGSDFMVNKDMENHCALNNVSAFSEAKRPSPIERHFSSNRFPSISKEQEAHSVDVEDRYANNTGTWQMWNTSPLGHDGLGLGGGSANWILPLEHDRSNKEDFMHSSAHNTIPSSFTHENHVRPDTHSPQKGFLGSAQNGGTFSPITNSSSYNPWLQRPLFPLLSAGENQFCLKPQEETNHSENISGNTKRSPVNHKFETSQSNWSKKGWALPDTGEATGMSSITRPHIGGLFPAQDVQSLWSYD